MSWTYGTIGLLFVYGAAAAGVLAGLVLGRAKFNRLFLFPLIAIPSLLAAALVWNLIAHSLQGRFLNTSAFNLLGFGFVFVIGCLAGRISAKVPDYTFHRRGNLLEPAVQRLFVPKRLDRRAHDAAPSRALNAGSPNPRAE